VTRADPRILFGLYGIGRAEDGGARKPLLPCRLRPFLLRLALAFKPSLWRGFEATPGAA
jgi:hypothetical protein